MILDSDKIQIHKDTDKQVKVIAGKFENTEGPVVAATDYVKLFADQIRAYVPRPYAVLGTDGFGRSDSREALRKHFEVDRYYITVAALNLLVGVKGISSETVKSALNKYKIDPKKDNPLMS